MQTNIKHDTILKTVNIGNTFCTQQKYTVGSINTSNKIENPLHIRYH